MIAVGRSANAEPQGIHPLPNRAIRRATASFTVPLIQHGTPPDCTGFGIWWIASKDSSGES